MRYIFFSSILVSLLTTHETTHAMKYAQDDAVLAHKRKLIELEYELKNKQEKIDDMMADTFAESAENARVRKKARKEKQKVDELEEALDTAQNTLDSIESALEDVQNVLSFEEEAHEEMQIEADSLQADLETERKRNADHMASLAMVTNTIYSAAVAELTQQKTITQILSIALKNEKEENERLNTIIAHFQEAEKARVAEENAKQNQKKNDNQNQMYS